MINDPDDLVFSAIISGCSPANRRILDVGCGGGELVARLAELAAEVVGVDPEREFVSQANEKYSSHKVRFIVSDSIGDLEENLRFDAIVFNKSLHHFDPELMSQALVDGAARLSDGDTILVVEPVFRGGTYQEIVSVYHNEQVVREAAKAAIKDFSKSCELTSTEQIKIKYETNSFEDLYESEIAGKPWINWNHSFCDEIEKILDSCPRSPDGGFWLDSLLDVYKLRIG